MVGKEKFNKEDNEILEPVVYTGCGISFYHIQNLAGDDREQPDVKWSNFEREVGPQDI